VTCDLFAVLSRSSLQAPMTERNSDGGLKIFEKFPFEDILLHKSYEKFKYGLAFFFLLLFVRSP
jgi:hypothetical protein